MTLWEMNLPLRKVVDFSGSLASFLLLAPLFAVSGMLITLSPFFPLCAFPSLLSNPLPRPHTRKMDLALPCHSCGVCLALFVVVVDFVCLFASHEVTLFLLSEILYGVLAFPLTLNLLFFNTHINEFLSPSQTHSKVFKKRSLFLIHFSPHFIFKSPPESKGLFLVKIFSSSSSFFVLPVPPTSNKWYKITTSLEKRKGEGFLSD